MPNRLQGLLSDPTFNLGVGLLGSSGPSRNPVSLGQALGGGMQFASERERQAFEMEQARAAAAQQQQQQAAQARFSEGLLGPGGAETYQSLLAQAFPDQVGQQAAASVFGKPNQERAMPAEARLAQWYNDPATPQKHKDFFDARAQVGDSVEQLDLIVAQLNADRLASQNRQDDEDRRRVRFEAESSINESLDRLVEIHDLNDRLRGTFATPGFGLNELRADAAGPRAYLTNLFGGDGAKARQVAADIQRFETLTTTEAFEQLFSGQEQTTTNDKLNTFMDTKPGLGNLPEVNASVIEDMIGHVLDSSRFYDGFEPRGREAAEAVLGIGDSQNAPEIFGGGSGVASKSYDQILQMGPSEVRLITLEELKSIPEGDPRRQALDEVLTRAGF